MARFIDDYTLYLLAQASAAASAGFHARLKDQGVAVAEWRILASLYPGQAAGVSELAQTCLTKQSTMTRQIDRLAQQGLVTRQGGDDDRRRVSVTLTEPGRALTARLTQQATAHEAEMLDRLDTTEISALKRALQKLVHQKT